MGPAAATNGARTSTEGWTSSKDIARPLPHNDPAHLRRPLVKQYIPKSRGAAAVGCSDWLAAALSRPLLKRVLRMKPRHLILVPCRTPQLSNRPRGGFCGRNEPKHSIPAHEIVRIAKQVGE